MSGTSIPASRPASGVPTATSPFLSIVVPIFNEADSVSTLLDQLHTALDRLGVPYEIIAVDDGSHDTSFALLHAAAHRDPRLRVVRFRRNFGQTAAFVAGFDRARGNVVVTLDADLQNDPQDIARLLTKIDEGFDVVSGWRVNRQDPFWSRRLPSLLANGLIRVTTGVRLHDFGCSLKAYRRDVLDGLPLYGELHRLIPAIASWQGVAVAEVPVQHHPRRFGRSKYGIGRTVRVFLDILTVRYFLTHGTRPMHVFGVIGILMGIIGGALLTYLAFIRLWLGQSIGDRPLLLLGVLLTVMAVQFISLGLLAEMLVRAGPLGTRAVYRVRDELNIPTASDAR